jgi:hypothetical protein
MVINSTNINKTKESLNSDGHQFHQYQQNKESLNSDGHQFHQYQQNKRKFKQRWSSIPPISTKQTIISRLNSWNIKKTMTYDVVNPGPGLGQAQKCGVELNKLMGSQLFNILHTRDIR